MKQTPMMKQYLGFKEQYPDKIVLFRMGDFYETFGEDAKIAAKVLNITLTTRDKKSDPTPLAGIPYHALDQYLPKIVAAGETAVVVEQVEDPKQAKGVVKRAVTRVITPGTLDGDLASNVKNSYLMAIYAKDKEMGMGILDLSTGEFKITQRDFTPEAVDAVITAYDPSEILLTDKQKDIKVGHIPVQLVEDYIASTSEKDNVITKFYNAQNIQSTGLDEYKKAASAVAMLLAYTQETQRMDPEHIGVPQYFSSTGTMVLDRATVRNLDLVANSYTGQIRNSLFDILDDTKTRMGKRTLYSWILNPLLDKKAIDTRLDVVNEFYSNSQLLADVREMLGNISDVERIVGKIGLNRANGRDLKALQESLEKAQEVAMTIKENKKVYNSFTFNDLFKKGDASLANLAEKIEETITDEPPTTITDGRVIKLGYNSEVDELRSLAGNSKDWVKEFAEKEKAETGIPSLKIGFNRVFGYYIEVTKVHSDKVPEHYVRKQTLVNSERYITDELKKKEDIILGAEEKLSTLEYKLFQQFREDLIPYLGDIKSLGHEVSKLDVLCSFAEVARNFSYIRPTIYDFGKGEGVIKIVGGRHPVVERLTEEEFVSNDTDLRMDSSRMCIITGPNMSGKSTFIRQVAVLVLMAQIGSFLPAKSADISLVDRIFSRVGASDDLSQGRSTFMVEMEEAANILNNATKHSLVILDEVGRGTSTYDGVSIAWALSEHLVNDIQARTLFATHYHELLQLASEHPEVVKNYNVYVKEDKDEVIFLRKIVEGGTDRSYGIYVAKLAGLPAKVVSRAHNILASFENGKEKKQGASSKDETPIFKGKGGQISFFSGAPDPKHSEIVERIKDVDINNLSPMDAFTLVQELKDSIK